MNKNDTIIDKGHETDSFKSVLDEVLRQGARKLLQQAIENEVEEYLQMTKHFTSS